MARVCSVELLNMCMIEDGEGRVLVLDKVGKGWGGLTFPGGHVEPGESLTAAMAREVLEETGLVVGDLKLCGIVNWAGADVRGLVLLYRAGTFCGTPMDGTEEGRVSWMTLADMRAGKLAPNMSEYLEIFLGRAGELFTRFEGGAWGMAKLL